VGPTTGKRRRVVSTFREMEATYRSVCIQRSVYDRFFGQKSGDRRSALPASEVPHRPQPFFSLLRSLLLCQRRRRDGKLLLALRDGAADVGLGLGGPVDGPDSPQRVVSAAESDLVLERLHRAHAHRHHPRCLGCTGHLLFFYELCDFPVCGVCTS
jgi:hypothetical protein